MAGKNVKNAIQFLINNPQIAEALKEHAKTDAKFANVIAVEKIFRSVELPKDMELADEHYSNLAKDVNALKQIAGVETVEGKGRVVGEPTQPPHPDTQPGAPAGKPAQGEEVKNSNAEKLEKAVTDAKAREDVKKVLANYQTGQINKSETMRKLHRLGIETGAIAKILEVRYQFVYQVIARTAAVQQEADAAKKEQAASAGTK